MARTFLRQDTQIRQSDLFDGTLLPGTTLETGSASIEGDLNSLRSQVYNLMKKQTGGNWYDDLGTPANFPSDTPSPSKRAVDNLNTDLREIERKRVLVTNQSTLVTPVPVGIAATGTLTTTANFANGETVTTGTKTYTFETVLTNVDGNVLIGVDAQASLANLAAAIDLGAGSGSVYAAATTANTFVSATSGVSTLIATSLSVGTAGNSTATTETATNASWGGVTLSGGTTGSNFVILSAGQLPSATIVAIGAVSTLGTVAAYNATFGSHSTASVSGTSPVIPKNLCEVFDSATNDPILSSGRTIYALFQSESNTDGSTLTGTTPNRAQLSFVRLTATGTALEAVPSADIQNHTVHYASIQRKGLSDLNEQDFLRGASMDTPAGTSTSRQGSYDAQGTTPVELVTNAALDLNSAGIYWELRDLLNATLFRLTEGSTGGTTTLAVSADVDVLNVNSILNNINRPLRVDIAGQQIDIGVTTGTIESTGVNDLRLYAANDLYLDDLHQTGSTWTGTNGVKLSTNTAEWSLYKTNYGEVSLLNAINQAKNPALQRTTKVYALVTLQTNADTDVGGVGGGTNLDAQLPNFTGGSFLTDYDVFLNGNLLRPGANSGANHDYYPGTSLANGQLKFEFKVKLNDVLCVIPYA
jgi:hypothetical protein